MNATAWIVSLVSIIACIGYVFWLKRSEAQDRLSRERQAKDIQDRFDAIAKSDREAAVNHAAEVAKTQGDLPLDDWIAQEDAKRGRK